MHTQLSSGASRRRMPIVLASILCTLAFGAIASAHGAPGKTTYRVINLSGGEVASAFINAHGQVAYSMTPDVFTAPINAYFYNGISSQNLGSLDAPGDFARAAGITDSGRVVGVSNNALGQTRVFTWRQAAGMSDIGTLPGADEALEPVINNLGVVTAIAHNTATTFNRGFRWSALGGITDLGVLAPGPAASSYPRAINDAGVIVGDSWAFGADYHAFRWTFGTGIVDIHTNASNDSTPVGVSATGRVAGNYHVDGEDWRGYVWTSGSGMVDVAPPAVRTWLTGMTSGGRVIGQVGDPFVGTRAMTWTQGGGLVDLGTLGGAISSAQAANNKGQVVGGAQTGAGPVRAYVWSAREGMVDLNTRLRHAPPGIVLNFARAISDNGSIVVQANTGLVLLKPVSKTPCRCPHSVGPIVTGDLVAVGAPLDASVGVAGEHPAAAYGVTWNWGDGNAARMALTSGASGEARASASHSYARPGIYTVTARVADRSGKGVDVSRTVVAYLPSAGMAAGAGSFISPYAAGKPAQRQLGQARFSFIAPAADAQPAGAAMRACQAALHFGVDGLDFVSRDVRRVAAPGRHGRFEGSGTLNGKGGYRFALVATASNSAGGEPGRVQMTIWHRASASGKETVVYDNSSDSGDAGRARSALRGDAGGSAVATSGGGPLVEGSIALY